MFFLFRCAFFSTGTPFVFVSFFFGKRPSAPRMGSLRAKESVLRKGPGVADSFSSPPLLWVRPTGAERAREEAAVRFFLPGAAGCQPAVLLAALAALGARAAAGARRAGWSTGRLLQVGWLGPARAFSPFITFSSGISRRGREFVQEREKHDFERARAIGQGEGRVPLYLFCLMNFRTLTMWISFITYPDDKHRHG